MIEEKHIAEDKPINVIIIGGAELGIGALHRTIAAMTHKMVQAEGHERSVKMPDDIIMVPKPVKEQYVFEFKNYYEGIAPLSTSNLPDKKKRGKNYTKPKKRRK
jgi:hypothetical protein